jgi:hypothetical protein
LTVNEDLPAMWSARRWGESALSADGPADVIHSAAGAEDQVDPGRCGNLNAFAWLRKALLLGLHQSAIEFSNYALLILHCVGPPSERNCNCWRQSPHEVLAQAPPQLATSGGQRASSTTMRIRKRWRKCKTLAGTNAYSEFAQEAMARAEKAGRYFG